MVRKLRSIVEYSTAWIPLKYKRISKCPKILTLCDSFTCFGIIKMDNLAIRRIRSRFYSIIQRLKTVALIQVFLSIFCWSMLSNIFDRFNKKSHGIVVLSFSNAENIFIYSIHAWFTTRTSAVSFLMSLTKLLE